MLTTLDSSPDHQEEMPHHGAETTRSQKTAATLWERITAFIIDALIIFLIIVFLHQIFTIPAEHLRLLVYLLIFLYMVFFWRGRRGATLGMMLIQIKVVTQAGDGLSWPTTLLRAGGLLTIMITLLTAPANALSCWRTYRYGQADMSWPWLDISMLLALHMALLIPAFSQNTLCLHDLLSRSWVVHTHSVIKDRRDCDFFLCWANIEKLVGIMIFYGMFSALAIQLYQIDLNGRLSYALHSSQEKFQKSIEEYYASNGHFPKDANALGLADSYPFPAGGGFRLGENGIIHIWFSVLPEFKGQTLQWIPQPQWNGKLVWKCQNPDQGLKWSLRSMCK
ncbi:MAG: hypothetical protein G8345_02590 [Magnetococcales bacterium]|nr:RDD family protein [Magnetococcales bacterium]NGZ25759.1 hypothetical protein [Magnetococcales bacterium]